MWYIVNMRTLYHPERASMTLSNVCNALSDPIRLQIVRALAITKESETACGVFGAYTPKSTMSHHFKVLREAGITYTRVDGLHRWVSLRYADLEARFPGLIDVVLRATSPL